MLAIPTPCPSPNPASSGAVRLPELCTTALTERQVRYLAVHVRDNHDALTLVVRSYHTFERPLHRT